MSRSARLAAGAALVGVAACGSASPAPPYGTPPSYDASLDVPADAGAEGGAGGSAGPIDAHIEVLGPPDAPPRDADSDRVVVPIYGAAAPVSRKPVR